MAPERVEPAVHVRVHRRREVEEVADLRRSEIGDAQQVRRSSASRRDRHVHRVVRLRTDGHPGRRRPALRLSPDDPGRRWADADFMRNVIVMGAGGRDFHDFNVVFRDDPETEVVAFTATQIPGIDDRAYPAVARRAALPGRDPDRPRGASSPSSIRDARRRRGRARLLRPRARRRHAQGVARARRRRRLPAARAATRRCSPATKPVVAVSAVRTGCGKSQTSRRVGRILLDAGLRVALVRHPMPYGDLEAMRVQRFATLEDIDARTRRSRSARSTSRRSRLGMVVYAGVDYERDPRARPRRRPTSSSGTAATTTSRSSRPIS